MISPEKFKELSICFEELNILVLGDDKEGIQLKSLLRESFASDTAISTFSLSHLSGGIPIEASEIANLLQVEFVKR